MSPTLLEGAVAIILIVAAWQIGLAIAPSVLHLLRTLRRDIDEVAETAIDKPDIDDHKRQYTEEHPNGTHH